MAPEGANPIRHSAGLDRSSIDWSVYVVADRRAAPGRPLNEVVRAAVAGGATVIQLRAKDVTTRDLVADAESLRRLTRELGVPFIVNDRLDVALAVGADGVHVGQDDMPASVARRLLGDALLLGVSAETALEARAAEQQGADYLGVGDIFGTASKLDAGTPVGPSRIAEICAAVGIPIVGIGGIGTANAGRVIEAGAAGVAVISAVMGAEDPEGAARELREVVNHARRRSGTELRS